MDTNTVVSAVNQAYTQLRRKIFQKEYRMGARLAEIELAKQIGLSRTPIREALRRLAAEGLVVILPNQGVWVASPTLEGMQQTYEVREKLEGMAIAKAALNIRPLFVAQLEEKIEEEQEIITHRDLDRYIDVNTDFHVLIAKAGGNKVLVDFVRKILDMTAVYAVFFEPFFNFNSLDEHRAILDALRRKDVAASLEAMQRHINRRFDHVLEQQAPLTRKT
jgi:DNA-binding GntR family transcriptional regulator